MPELTFGFYAVRSIVCGVRTVARRLAIIGCTTAACHPAPQATAPRPASVVTVATVVPAAPSASPSPVVAVARDIEVYEAPWGSPHVAHVDDADVLEWREDGFVRIALPSGEIHGYSVPPHARVGRGVGLFVVRDVRIVGPRGLAIGTAHAGAFLPLVRMQGDDVEVELPPFEVTGRVPRTEVSTRRAEPAGARYAESIDNHHASIDTGDGHAKATCDVPLGIFGEGPHGLRVAQTVGGIELEGVALDGIWSCPPRTIGRDARGRSPSLPPGFRTLEPFRTTLLSSSREFFRIRTGDGTPTCEPSSFSRSGKAKPTLRTTYAYRDLLDPTRTLRETMTYEVTGAPPVITHATEIELVWRSSVRRDERGAFVPERPGEGQGVGGADPSYLVVGERPDALVVIAGADDHIVAYHPDDVSLWYTKKESCETALARVRRLHLGGDD
jgi:hypothetical protein